MNKHQSELFAGALICHCAKADQKAHAQFFWRCVCTHPQAFHMASHQDGQTEARDNGASFGKGKQTCFRRAIRQACFEE